MYEIKTARVREIWLGNLPNNISESTLYNNFFIYGEIAKIDLHSDRVLLLKLNFFIL